MAGDKLHCCTGALPSEAHGGAVDGCWEREDGTLWVGNGEYTSQVMHCPYCGYEARVKPVVCDENGGRQVSDMHMGVCCVCGELARVWYDGHRYCRVHDPERRYVSRAVLVQALRDVRGELDDRGRGDYDLDSRCIGIIDRALNGGRDP